MTDYNKTTVHGRIVRNAEYAKTDSGLVIVKFSIGTNRARKLPDGSYADESSFFPLAVFGEYAERIFPRLVRGQGLTVEGHLKQTKWDKDGEKRSEIMICVEKLYFDANLNKEDEQKSMIMETASVSQVNGDAAMDFPPAEFLENPDIF